MPCWPAGFYLADWLAAGWLAAGCWLQSGWLVVACWLAGSWLAGWLADWLALSGDLGTPLWEGQELQAYDWVLDSDSDFFRDSGKFD